MLHVWTLWTKPWAGSDRPLDMNCLELSVRLVARRGHACRIHADARGASLLAGRAIPADVCVTLDPLADVPAYRWAMPKLHTYRLQDEAFCHVDHDVFLRQDPPPPADPSALVVQSREDDAQKQRLYGLMLQDYLQDTGAMAPEFSALLRSGPPRAVNCGYLRVPAGRLAFLRQYATRGMEILGQMRTFTHANNALGEQLLLLAMAEAAGVPVEVLLEGGGEQLQSAARAIGYTHLMNDKFFQAAKMRRKVVEELSGLLT